MSRLPSCCPTMTMATSLADGALKRLICSPAGRLSALITTLWLGVCICSHFYRRISTDAKWPHTTWCYPINTLFGNAGRLHWNSTLQISRHVYQRSTCLCQWNILGRCPCTNRWNLQNYIYIGYQQPLRSEPEASCCKMREGNWRWKRPFIMR